MAKIRSNPRLFFTQICETAAQSMPNFPKNGVFECYEDPSKFNYHLIFKRRFGNNYRIYETFVSNHIVIDQDFSSMRRIVCSFINRIIRETEDLDSDELTDAFIDIYPDIKEQDRLTNQDISKYRRLMLEETACFDAI